MTTTTKATTNSRREQLKRLKPAVLPAGFFFALVRTVVVGWLRRVTTQSHVYEVNSLSQAANLDSTYAV